MTDDESEQEFKRLAELLVERGFARVCMYEDTPKIASFDWTPAGVALQMHLRQLFDVPNVRPMDLTPEVISKLIMVIMLTKPRS